MRTKILTTLFMSACFAPACDGQTIDAGNDDGGTLRTYKWQGTVSNSFETPCPYPLPDEYKGEWVGAFNDYALPSGSKKLKFDVQGLSGNGLCGTVTFGEGELPPVPTDPEAPYAPGLTGPPVTYQASTKSRFIVVEGFPYEFGRMPVNPDDPPMAPELPDPSDGFRLDDVTFGQPYKAWCNLQTSYPRVTAYASGDVTDYLCVPGTAGRSGPDNCDVVIYEQESAKHVPVSCTQFAVCANTNICGCDTNGCTVRPNFDISGELYFDGDTMTGTIDRDLDPGLESPWAFQLTRVKP